MYLSKQEKDVVCIFSQATNPMDAHNKMQDYFNRNEKEIHACTKSLYEKGFISCAPVPRQGQHYTALKITAINKEMCDRYC